MAGIFSAAEGPEAIKRLTGQSVTSPVVSSNKAPNAKPNPLAGTPFEKGIDFNTNQGWVFVNEGGQTNGFNPHFYLIGPGSGTTPAGYSRYDFTLNGSGIPGVRDFNHAHRLYLNRDSGTPQDRKLWGEVEEWAVKKGFDPNNLTPQQAFTGLDLTQRDRQRKNQREPFDLIGTLAKIGQGVAPFIGGPVGLATGAISAAINSGGNPLATLAGAASGFGKISIPGTGGEKSFFVPTQVVDLFKSDVPKGADPRFPETFPEGTVTDTTPGGRPAPSFPGPGGGGTPPTVPPDPTTPPFPFPNILTLPDILRRDRGGDVTQPGGNVPSGPIDGPPAPQDPGPPTDSELPPPPTVPPDPTTPPFRFPFIPFPNPAPTGSPTVPTITPPQLGGIRTAPPSISAERTTTGDAGTGGGTTTGDGPGEGPGDGPGEGETELPDLGSVGGGGRVTSTSIRPQPQLPGVRFGPSLLAPQLAESRKNTPAMMSSGDVALKQLVARYPRLQSLNIF